MEAALALALRAVALLDISRHEGVHPRLGVVDVVPFVPYDSARPAGELNEEVGGLVSEAFVARRLFAGQLAERGIPCFFYGPERSLPEVRRRAFSELQPDLGPARPHPSAGACCVGVRDVLVAYNLLVDAPLERAREIARGLRRREVRSLGLRVGKMCQVSCNLVAPDLVGPSQVYDEVSRLAPVVSTELVGLLPARVLERVPAERWAALDLSPGRTVEAAFAAAGSS